jgi:nicotinamide phosphoribosyltransferase
MASQAWMTLPVPISIMADSYKPSHYLMYPDCQEMVAYGEFRAPFNGDKTDTRFVCYGMRYIVERYLLHQWTKADLDMAEHFYATHNVGGQGFPFPRDLFLKFITENKGFFPIKLEILEEGTVANVRVPVYQITAKGEYARLVTFFETIFTHVWYPSSVATLSRRVKESIKEGFDRSVDPERQFLLESRLHDFGFRGTTCVEQSIIGGVAHLINFTGSDTMSAAYYAQYVLNNGKPIASSLPATEHSVMTSWPSEAAAIRNMIEKFGGQGRIFACVMDSYDYNNALFNILPKLAGEMKKKGGTIVLRPDSGDPVDAILQALKAGEEAFGADVNKKGFKVLRGVAAIQGDGIDHSVVKKIIEAALKAGYSACNIAYGMGGGLLQKVNRDTMSFATKLSYIKYADGTERDIMKRPKTDMNKISFPGALYVKRVDGIPTIFPKANNQEIPTEENLLKTVYDCGPVSSSQFKFSDFEAVRARATEEWDKIPAVHDPISQELRDKVAQWVKDFDVRFAELSKAE